MYLLEDKGEVALYRNDSDQLIVTYGDNTFTLQNIKWDQNTLVKGEGWQAITADIYNDPLSENDGNILLLWTKPAFVNDPNNLGWQAISFSSNNGDLLGLYGDSGYFYSAEEMRSVSSDDPEYLAQHNDRYFGHDSYINPTTNGWEKISTAEHDKWEINQLGVLFPEIYYGVAKESSKEYSLSQEYELGGIKDFDGNTHANTGAISAEAKQAYKYQGILDVNNDGVKEAIFTNKKTGRWVTARTEEGTGEIDYTDHGSDGITRIVGIYEDPLVQSGDVIAGSAHDSQTRFQNDLLIDNLIVKTSGDYDGDGDQEVYWKTTDGTAYLRALMHADGNIQYANYQSEAQMSDYLTSNGYESVISEIV